MCFPQQPNVPKPRPAPRREDVELAADQRARDAVAGREGTGSTVTNIGGRLGDPEFGRNAVKRGLSSATNIFR